MACDKPLNAWQPNLGGTLEFNEPSPINVGRYTPIKIACGRCTGCRIAKRKEWTVRCLHEASLHENNHFVTLTYDEEKIPSDFSLDHGHFQLFMKRFRKMYPGVAIRFFVAGEYGGKTSRPHYHAIIFNSPVRDLEYWKKNDNGDKLYKSETYEKLWKKGFVTIGDVTKSSVSYTVGYLLKDHEKQWKNNYEITDPETGEIHKRRKPYCRMSNRPGIASDWFQKFKTDVFPCDFVVIEGKKQPTPSYYLNQLKETDPDLYELVTDQREEKMQSEAYQADNTQARRDVKAEARDRRSRAYRNREVL